MNLHKESHLYFAQQMLDQMLVPFECLNGPLAV